MITRNKSFHKEFQIDYDKIYDFQSPKNEIFQEFLSYKKEKLKKIRVSRKNLLDELLKYNNKKDYDVGKNRDFSSLPRSQSKKSCMASEKDRKITHFSSKSIKRVRFNNETEVSFDKKSKAHSILSLVREENKHLPEIFAKKRLYFKLNEKYSLRD